MNKLDNNLLKIVKQGFVPTSDMSEPVMGAGPMTAGLTSGGIGASPGGDPNAGGMPMDPAMAQGGMPMDPAMQGAAPVDPNAGGAIPPELLAALSGTMPGGTGGGAAPGGPGTITLTVEQLIQLVQAFGNGGKKKPAGDTGAGGASVGGAAPDMSGITDKLDKILQAINPPSAGAPMSGVPPQAGATPGAAPGATPAV